MSHQQILGAARATGRTTRMLEHAQALADDGKRVTVVAITEEDAQRLRKLLREDTTVKVVNKDAIAISWTRADLLGPQPPRAVALFDHAVIEAALKPTLIMLHQFDLPQKDAP